MKYSIASRISAQGVSYIGKKHASLFHEHKKKIQKEQQKKAAIEALERVPTVTPTPAATATPTPEPTATVTPTPVITRAPAFMASDYMGTWYSKDGLVTLSIDDLTLKSVTFTFSQAGDNAGTKVSEASDTAKSGWKCSKAFLYRFLGKPGAWKYDL